MRLVHSRVLLLLVLGVALVGSIGIILRQYRQLTTCQEQHAAEQKSLREAQESIRHRDLQKAPAIAEEPAVAGGDQATLAKQQGRIEQLNSELAEAHVEVTQMQAQLHNSTDDRARAVASADERYRKAQADWQGQLGALQQQLDAATAESQASRQRLADLEAANAKSKSESIEGSARAADYKHVSAQLQDVERRRDVYLTSVIRRYRDITSQFRAMGGMLDSSRDATAGACSGVTLTRIQNAVALADDDLRQLNEVNAQARQLEDKLIKK